MVDIVINGRFLTQKTTGVQRVAREITRALDRLIAEELPHLSVRLICQPSADLGDLELAAITVQRVGGFSGQLWEQLSLPRAARGAKLLCLANSAPILSLLSAMPPAVVIHDLSYRHYPHAYRMGYRIAHSALMPALLRRADPLVTVSVAERDELLKLTDRGDDPIVVAQNGSWRSIPAATNGSPSLGKLPDRGYLLYIGALSQRKNIMGVLSAAIQLAREDGTPFVFVGSSTSVHTSMAFEIPDDVSDRIVLLGHIEDAAVLAELYAGAAALVFPSFYEASPLPPLEAMHFGCPVVVSDIPAFRERCGDAAEYCDPFDVSSIVGAVRNVLYNQPARDALIRKGGERARSFTWERQARIVLDAVLQSLEHGRSDVMDTV